MESIPVLTTAKEKIAIITITRPGLEKAAALLKGLDATLYVSERYAGEAPEGHGGYKKDRFLQTCC